MGLPGYRRESLPHGGVIHQLSPSFVVPDGREAKSLRQQVIAYCSEHGYKVSCHAPYHVAPGGREGPATKDEQIPDSEAESYLRQLLATTLVLDDGTRVKPIYIPWEALTANQRQIALAAIKHAAISEIKRPERKRIVFEFNEIPQDLDQMMADLVGRDNPDFEWKRVDMTPTNG